MSQTIEIVVSPTGAVQVQTRGFTGSTCQAASRFLQEALGQQTSEQLTSEFYLPAVNQHTLQEGL